LVLSALQQNDYKPVLRIDLARGPELAYAAWIAAAFAAIAARARIRRRSYAAPYSLDP
jgi:hypothetical protein